MTSETESATEAEFMEATQQRAQKRRLLIGIVAGTALLAACAVVAATASDSARSQQTRTADYVSKYLDEDSGMGCANWAELTLQTLSSTSKSECDEACRALEDCVAFNLQPYEDCVGGERAEAKRCYLFKAGCVKEPQDCWDYFTIATGE